MDEIMKVWEDINFTAQFKKTHDHFVDFSVSKIHDENNFFKTEIFLHGDVKYDGCSNIDFDVLNESLLHFCSKEEAGNLGVLLERIYDTAFEMMPEYAD